MANYIIIGGDGKEYGPVTADELRRWIAEGRLNAQSRAKAESDAEFRTLEKFPEFAAALLGNAQPAPTIAAPAGADPAYVAAMQAIKAPAMALKIISIFNFLLSLWSFIKLTFFRQTIQDDYAKEFAKYPQLQDPAIQKWVALIYGPLGIGSDIFSMAMAALVFFGACKMQKLKGYEFAFVATIIAMLPCVTACCLLGLPFGIWALVVLNKTEIKSQFK